MADPIAEFFTALTLRHDTAVRKITGTIRCDLVADGRIEYWFVDIKDGDMDISREKRDADCLIRADKTLFCRFVTGEGNAIVAWLGYRIYIAGRTDLFRAFERLFPGPVGARDPRNLAGGRGSLAR
ncbi:SCP2 sterol-binding domain-containing protein [Micromonospora sp. L31]|uniref:SCP2 sterol-binding domain-containing protein n=1 Tax=Micromonospora sp. L31 TaxID=3452213 RepID=UPI003F8B7D18